MCLPDSQQFVIVTIQPRAEFGYDDHREDAPRFIPYNLFDRKMTIFYHYRQIFESDDLID